MTIPEDIPQTDRLSTYDYELPPERIAQTPAEHRDQARLMVVDRARQTWQHASIVDLPQLLNAGDSLVLNNSRVIPAKLEGYRAATRGRWEGLFLNTDHQGHWRLIGQTRGRLQAGEYLEIPARDATSAAAPLPLHLVGKSDEGVWTAIPASTMTALELLERYGTVPLPPYVERLQATATDRERYQTVYAERPGSIAAPTAGLHFTPQLIEACRRRGVQLATVTLHVGIGTFRPVACENVTEHQMHYETAERPSATAAQILATRARGGRVVAVGTTTVRTLESAAAFAGTEGDWRGETNLFIRPPYSISQVDALLTNFHLPKSTLLMLVSALAGVDLTLAAYRAAVEDEYRFFSYGDAMLIV